MIKRILKYFGYIHEDDLPDYAEAVLGMFNKVPKHYDIISDRYTKRNTAIIMEDPSPNMIVVTPAMAVIFRALRAQVETK